MKPVNKSVSRTAILKAIKFNLDYAAQWVPACNYANAAEGRSKAEALIEILEADDCGSHGGFDQERGQPGVDHSKDDLLQRYKWLARLK